MHAKLAAKQPRSEATDGPEVFQGPDAEERKGEASWYPLKLMLSLKKSRMLFFESRRMRKEVLEAILTE
jgi:hypothetical protein